MLAKKILSNLENGNYRIERRENDCGIYWDTWDTINNGGCYYENVLIMDDLAGQCDDVLSVGSDGVFATYDVHFGTTVRINCLNHAVVQQILELILNDGEIRRKLIAGIN